MQVRISAKKDIPKIFELYKLATDFQKIKIKNTSEWTRAAKTRN